MFYHKSLQKTEYKRPKEVVEIDSMEMLCFTEQKSGLLSSFFEIDPRKRAWTFRADTHNELSFVLEKKLMSKRQAW
jgi:hypothetical protein